MSGELILYVDDNQANRILVSRVLRSLGYRIIEAENGVTGVDAARKNKPDLILMDINLPDIDGYEATNRIRKSADIAETPVIALTANAMIGDREKALKAGCDGYISKPVDVETLPRQVRDYLEAFAKGDGSDKGEPEAEDAADEPASDKKPSVLNRKRSVLNKGGSNSKPRKSRPSILGRSKTRSALNKKSSDDEKAGVNE